MSKHEDDLRYLFRRQAELEQQIQATLQLQHGLTGPHQKDRLALAQELERKLRIDLDMIEYTIGRDRINRGLAP